MRAYRQAECAQNQEPGPIPVGSRRNADGSWDFVVWAPHCADVNLHTFGGPPGPIEGPEGRRSSARFDGHAQSGRSIEMERDSLGYFRATLSDPPTNCLYLYGLSPEGGKPSKRTERPDPASLFQPTGVHGPSQLVDLGSFSWTDQNWKPPALERSVFYELHVGTYTPAGTFDAVIERLPELADLGITTIELMPVAQFPGARNWGYDGVYPYAVQNTYGGPAGLQRLVNAAHAHGLAVALDVVYNHLGPEGNYLAEFGPYFTHRYGTPWGKAINFDGPHSDPVREFFIRNAIYWFEDHHIDVLRLDAVHGIFDFGAVHFLAELQERVADAAIRLGRELILIAESDLNDTKVVFPRAAGGYGIRAQWSDDFHHSLHAVLTHESNGYYADFGSARDFATVLEQGWLYTGQYSRFRKKRHGSPANDLARSCFVVCSQNHDQIGNRAQGERLGQLIDFEQQKLAAGATLLSPFIPLLFMGEEYGETAPFLYFTDHGDDELIERVRSGRRAEFIDFGWHQDVPDPQDPRTFQTSTLQHLEDLEPHKTLRNLYKTILGFRKDHELGSEADWKVACDEKRRTVTLTRLHDDRWIAIVFNFGNDTADRKVLKQLTGFDFTLARDGWSLALDSAADLWRGPRRGSGNERTDLDPITVLPKSFLVLQRNNGF
jgi:maltooligosyltrehalose trehalohydrolase